ncbi:MAG: mevalonate kinase, partial [Anaerolineae bacterium]|nr:mevalonate kinase [Anaerolineae bacterium]
AVVHGQPAIAVPVSELRASVSAEHARNGLKIFSINKGEVVRVSRHNLHPLAVTARLTLEKMGIQTLPNLSLTLKSDIPMGSGLGSGAAVSTALARALCTALNKSLSLEALNAVVYEVEKLHHGTPSGIDNTVVVYEKPVYFVRGQPLETFSIARPFTLLIADTGIHASTKVTVGDVRKLYDSDPERITPIFERIGELVRQAREAIETGQIEVLGPLMNENHVLLRDLTVSSPPLDRLCQAAVEAGAMGAKLSGGGRGGNMLALVTEEDAAQVTDSLLKNGAVRVMKTTLQPR